MGNVSLAMPSIHPCIAIETAGAVEPPARVRGRVRQRVGRPSACAKGRSAWRGPRSTPRAGHCANACSRSLGVSAVVSRRPRRRSRRCRSTAVPGSGRPRSSRSSPTATASAAASGRSRPCSSTVLPFLLAFGQSVAGCLVGVALAPQRVREVAGGAGRCAGVQHDDPELVGAARRCRRRFRGGRRSWSWCPSSSVLVVVVALGAVVLDEPLGEPSSTICSSTTPMMTASRTRPAPRSAAALAPARRPRPGPRACSSDHSAARARAHWVFGSARRPSMRTRRRSSRWRRNRFTVSGS